MEPIAMNDRIYRCVTPPSETYFFGSWEFLYNGKWCKVINYQIRLNLKRLVFN